MTVLAALVALTLGMSAQVSEHPVPLEKNFDAAKCVDCHAEKQQGKHVHTAISMGCTTCHSVASTGEKTEITLTAPRDKLCATCHEQAKETTVHQPYAKNQCLTCHDPHASEFPAQTRAPGNTLCLGCHADRPMRGKTVQLFASREMSAEEFAQVPKIDLDKAQRVGHPLQDHPVAAGPDPSRPGENFGCLSCHVPHAAPLEKLLTKEWAKAQVCDDCHQTYKVARNKP